MSVDGLVSQAVSMAGANGVEINVTAIAVDGTSPSVTVDLQVSNDLENWTDEGNIRVSDINAAGYKASASSSASIAALYVRLKYSLSGTKSPIVVLAAGIHTVNL